QGAKRDALRSLGGGGLLYQTTNAYSSRSSVEPERPPPKRKAGCSSHPATAIAAGRSVSDPCGLISRIEPGATPGPATNSGSASKGRLVPPLRCKRSPFGQEVRFLPLPTMRT